MSRTKPLTTTALFLIALTSIAPAAAQEPPAPPSKPPVENDGLKMFTGSWKCEGTAMLGPGKTAKIKATAKVKNELGGFWQSFVYTEQKTKDYPMAITAMGRAVQAVRSRRVPVERRLHHRHQRGLVGRHDDLGSRGLELHGQDDRQAQLHEKE